LGLGKEGIHSLTSWSQEIRTTIETKLGHYTSVPSNVDLRRNTVAGAESDANGAVIPLQTVSEEEERSGANLGRSVSLRSLGLNADVPRDVNSVRSSIQSFSNLAPPAELPPSANSEMTLFEDFEAGLQSGPQAESTPHNSTTQKPVSRRPPPPMPEKRRSTIRYIKSDTNTENGQYSYPLEQTASHNTKSTPHLTTRTRSVVPKASRMSHSPSDASIKETGLRQLTLLQDRANIVSNTNANGRSSPTAEIRPLAIGKKQKSRIRPLQLQQRQDENASIPIMRNKNIKELSLTRSETARARGILRQTEVLPEVVIRPPSTFEHQAFAYSVDD